ncbi:GumC family protein [Limimaricola pyoseonensis]|uniref:non-specific protein-tyrosine kinase n=1 Tax=Limimaricola pyoseonensis TaxID=521013 RepID=A0A1G7KKH1_9RHOB|nr:polysaccharide biosynthesis tyrosine autokinase [Limimaricola pyoseonensis]SDF37601.1 capsular exopolysaccharide family [Limimaricola pyoseonensis]
MAGQALQRGKPRLASVNSAQVQTKPETEDEIDLVALLRTLWRGKWLIMLCAVAAMTAGVYYATQVAVPKYSASTSVALQVQAPQMVDLDSVMSGVSTDDASMNTEVEVIRSRGLLEKLVAELDLLQDPEFNIELRPDDGLSLGSLLAPVLGREETVLPAAETQKAALIDTVDRLRETLGASVQRDTFILNISATTEDPRKSARVANTLAELYIEDQIAVKFEGTENAVTWLSERVTALEEELRQKEDQIARLRSESELVSPEALEGLNRQAKDVRDRLSELEDQAARDVARLQELRAAFEASDFGTLGRLANDGTLRQLVTRLEDGESGAGELVERRAETVIARAESDLERTRSQVTALETSLGRLQSQIEAQGEELAQLQQLEREAQATQTLYETFLARLKETTVQRGMHQADARVLSIATPGEKVEPRTARIGALALVLGLMAGAGIVLLREATHSGFRTSEDLEGQTGETVLGQIPKMPIRKRGQLIPYLNDKPTSAAAEAIRNLRTSVLLSKIDAAPQVILSTSSVPGEGKTTTAISLAHNLAGLGKSVLLIEGDIRRRTLNEYFEKGAKAGLLSVLTDKVAIEEAVIRQENYPVDVLMGEKSTVNAADLFSSEAFKTFVERMRTRYDYIVIDTPPVLVVPDTRIIAALADAIIYTVRWDHTPRAQVSEGLKQFRTVGAEVTGLALSQIDPKGMKRYGYGGRHGAYASYGQGYYDA